MIFRQLFDSGSSTYSYLLADDGSALLIDPVLEQAARDAALIAELGLKLLWTLETHVHADHITGASILKELLGSRIGVSATANATGADRVLREGDKIEFGSRFLDARTTPGHTAGCLTYVLDDQAVAFTGDCLLIRGCGRTDFQGGSSTQLYRSIREKIFTLPDDCLLYPGHDYRGLTVTSVREEKLYNPRLGLPKTEAEFAHCMANLNLAYPKKIDVAVPANLSCGRESRVESST
jgi:glyoxylase-like metal-dependent hydrolase (beta-lactamase superfamily II)